MKIKSIVITIAEVWIQMRDDVTAIIAHYGGNNNNFFRLKQKNLKIVSKIFRERDVFI